MTQVLEAEKKIASLHRQGAGFAALREAQAERQEALGNHEKAATFRAEAQAYREAHGIR